MNGMPKPEAEQAEAPEAAANVSPKQLVTGIHTQMMALMDMLSKSPGIGDEAKAGLGGIISQYQDFVKNELGSAPGQKAPQGPQAPGSVTPEQAGNPNARPM
jgi:hypothetical protein